MSYQSVFQRYELKYMLTVPQKELLLRAMEPYMQPDCYAHATIRNIYLDTDNYRLIRHSMEKPAYKEKLRLRSYARSEKGAPVFVELKKKYKSVVYKRRIALPEQQAMDWLCGKADCPEKSQIADEIDYFRQFYAGLHPSVFLSYQREAYCSQAGDPFRVTFDEQILYREEDITLDSGIWGTPLLPDGMVLMELKTPGGIPLWLTHFLTEQRIFKTYFSKYGSAYSHKITNQAKGAHDYVQSAV